MIRAETHTDDRTFEIDFDATPWFEQATPQEIVDLLNCDWGGGYAADAVAEFFNGTNQEITNMFHYIYSLKGADVGFECHVDEDDAVAWLDQNRPGWRNGGQAHRGRLATSPPAPSKNCRKCGAVSAGGQYCPNGCGKI